MVGAFFSHGNLNLFENFKLASQRKYNISVVQLITIGEGVACIAAWSEGTKAGCTTWGKVSIVAEDKEASSAKTVVCECKKCYQ